MTSLEKKENKSREGGPGDEVMSLLEHRGRMLTQTVAQGGRQRGAVVRLCGVKASGEAQKN